MPLYKVTFNGEDRLVYAKTPRGAENYILDNLRTSISTSRVTPIEAAALAATGVPVETVNKGPDVVMEDDPPEAIRGFVPESIPYEEAEEVIDLTDHDHLAKVVTPWVEATIDQDGDPTWEDEKETMFADEPDGPLAGDPQEEINVEE